MRGENSWFETAAGQALALDAIACAEPWLRPIVGHKALAVLPCTQGLRLPELQCTPVMQLQRARGRLFGEFIADDARIPLVNDCLALVFAAFVLETSADGDALLAEFERLLVGEGHLAVLALNPLAPRRPGRWRGLALASAEAQRERLARAGFDVLRQESVGARYRPPALRPVNFLLARKRRTALTPIRKTAPAVALARESTPR